jgi:leader peptidase (prepilin peptidase) / N-methyltransferase
MSHRASLFAIPGAGAFVLLGVLHGANAVALARLAVVGAALAAAAVIDLRERRIPNRIVLPAAGACAVLAGPAILRHSLAALALVAVLLLLALVQPAALGMGDIKAALLIALALGAAAVPALVIGLGLAAAVGAACVLRRGRSAFATALPLAPFLAAGAAVALAFA